MGNNKLIKIVLLITVIVFISCCKNHAPKNINTDEVIIEVSYADESFLKKYKTYDSFINDDDLVRIAFTSNIPVKDFSWLYITIEFDEYTDEFVYDVGEELYTLEELHPQKPLVVSWTEVGMMSCFGFSYREDGQKKYFIGRVGNYGADPEEYDGPAFLVGQFFPKKIIHEQ